MYTSHMPIEDGVFCSTTKSIHIKLARCTLLQPAEHGHDVISSHMHTTIIYIVTMKSVQYIYTQHYAYMMLASLLLLKKFLIKLPFGSHQGLLSVRSLCQRSFLVE